MVASEMALSPSLIYKWCEPKGEDSCGADNPLDRILNLCNSTGDSGPIIWLCEQVNAFFVVNASPDAAENDAKIFSMTQQILKEFSEMLEMVSQSISDDGGVDMDEARAIRVEWEDLKRIAEQFVLFCEMGHFASDKN